MDYTSDERGREEVMTMDEALETAARAVCAADGSDPDELLEWGPYVGGSLFRVNPRKERWRCVVDRLDLHYNFIALSAVGALRLETPTDG
jgi:hypothetical protein